MHYLPDPKDYHKYWYIDCEADGLWPSKLWVMCASRMDQTEVYSFVGHTEIKNFFDGLAGQEVYYVGHNIIPYDAIHTERLAGGRANVSNCVDSLVLSYLYDPSLAGGHSLEAWGHRLKDPKASYDDWSKYTPEMDKYCQQDVKLGKKVVKALWQRMRRLGYSEQSCYIEHRIRSVLDVQQRNGWKFDIPGAQSLVSHLRNEQSGLENQIRELFPSRFKVSGTYTRRYRKDGSDYSSYLRHKRDYPEIVDNGDGTYSTLEWSEFNIGSPKQRTERLLELGYEPTDYTPGGSPKVDEESLLRFAEQSGYAEVEAIAKWLVIQGRSTMVEGWLNNVNYDDSCIHGQVITCGANTRRMLHRKPNSANVPKAKPKVRYGKECRQLWVARPGRKLVGKDASGLELRMFAEYLNDPKATEMYTTGDPHLYNTRLLEMPDEYRDLYVKNILYATLYGAGDPKLGKTANPSIDGRESGAYGKWVRERLMSGIPGLAGLTDLIQQEFKQTGGLLKTIDGGFVRCPRINAALNYKLQSGGAILMKYAAIIHLDLINEKGLDGFHVGNIHDEIQSDCDPRDVEEVGKLGVAAIEQAGLELNCKVPFTGEYKIGDSWASTH